MALRLATAVSRRIVLVRNRLDNRVRYKTTVLVAIPQGHDSEGAAIRTALM